MARDRRDEPVVLSRIYTRTGDDGTTALGDGSRAAKTDPRLAAYADVDEANCAIGMAITLGGLPAGLVPGGAVWSCVAESMTLRRWSRSSTDGCCSRLSPAAFLPG